MQRALYLAQQGRTEVSPNPMVGCVIVCDGLIIGEGYHEKYGGPHAEVNAINSVKDKSLLSNSIVYVSLEPCAHFGKTPPCADLLVASNVKKVVIGMQDPFPEVAGKGIAKLKSAGIEVEVGVEEEACRKLNARFLSRVEKNRPYIILKWAQSREGYIGSASEERVLLSGPLSNRLVHQWRVEEDAILVGVNTANWDNPSLTNRYVEGKNPKRILIDPNLKAKPDLNLFSDHGCLIFNRLKSEVKGENEWVQIDATSKSDFLKKMLYILAERKIQSLLVEGGKAVLDSFIESGLWDEARVIHTGASLHEGVEAPKMNRSPKEIIDLREDRLFIH